jgi:geranylgeranyl pyrophosphate synthase
MLAMSRLEEQCYQILEEKGGKIADEARTILLREMFLKGLRQPLRYVSNKWRDHLAPSLVVLSSEAVGGKPDEHVGPAALALSLMNLSFRLWDDVIDKTEYRRFVPTVFGKFGTGVTLIIGGLASAKAFSILSNMEIDELKREEITKLIWNYWVRMAEAETINLKLRKRANVKPEEKLKVFEMEGATPETSLRIGATLQNGSSEEIDHLGNYGRYLGVILELRKDLNASLNLTLELSEKIKNGSLPYTLLWAKNNSGRIQECLSFDPDTVVQAKMKELVKAILETSALENISRLIKKYAVKAKKEISTLSPNKSTTTLLFLVEAQHRLFVESLSELSNYQTSGHFC